MIGLVLLVDEHTEEVEYDLIRAGVRLRDWPNGGVSWRDLWVLVRQAQPDSAIYRARNPKTWQRSIEVDLLQAVDMRIQALLSAWGGPRPKLIEMPWDEPEVARPDELDFDSVVAQMAEHRQRHLRVVG